MDSISFGNVIYINPTEDQKLEAKKYKDDRNRKIQELDNKAYEIVDICEENHRYMNIKEIDHYVDKLAELQNQRIGLTGGRYNYPPPNPYSEFFGTLRTFMDLKEPEWYKIPVTLLSTEIVNGFALHEIKENPGKSLYWYTDFLEMEALYNTPNTMTKKEFMEKYDEEACSDWSKQDECGECYGGFWNFPEGSYKRKNAYTLSRKVNGAALYKLPYSHALIFKTIEMGCCNRMESVKYTNTICEYIKRKLSNKTEV